MTWKAFVRCTAGTSRWRTGRSFRWRDGFSAASSFIASARKWPGGAGCRPRSALNPRAMRRLSRLGFPLAGCRARFTARAQPSMVPHPLRAQAGPLTQHRVFSAQPESMRAVVEHVQFYRNMMQAQSLGEHQAVLKRNDLVGAGMHQKTGRRVVANLLLARE